MTVEEAKEMMKAKLECMTREVSGADQECNAKKCDDCDLCYAQGNMGEQKEWLRMGIEALEKQKTGHWVKDEEMSIMFDIWICSECGSGGDKHFKYCACCGAKMKGE